MRLNKTTALFLTKVLFHYEQACPISDSVKGRVKDLRTELNDFLLDETLEEEDSCSGCCHDHDDYARPVDGTLTLDEEEEIEDDEEEDEDSEASDEDEEEEEDPTPVADATVNASELHDLPACPVSDGGLEFEHVEAGHVDFLVGGFTEVEEVTHIKRSGKAIEVFANGEWHNYDVPRFPKAWTRLLKAGDVYDISGE